MPDPIVLLGLSITGLALGCSWLVRRVHELRAGQAALLPLMNELERRIRVLEGK